MGGRQRVGFEFPTLEQNDGYRSALPDVSPPFPELRIVRHVDLEAPNRHDWREFVDDVGVTNYDEGIAKAYGSIAVVYVTATEMGQVLRSTFPRLCANPGKLRERQREIAKDVNAFVRTGQQIAYDDRTAEMEAAHSDVAAAVLVGFSNELWDGDGMDLPLEPADGDVYFQAQAEIDDRFQVEVLPTASDPMPYAEGRFAVKGIARYGRGYGLDLSGNPELYEDRDGIIRHLKKDQGLDTKAIERRNWEPHGTIFKRATHEGNMDRPYALEYHQRPPSTIDLLAPAPIVSKNA